MASDSSKKTEKLECAIDLICGRMSDNRKYHQSKDEDELTIHIVDHLQEAGFEAGHDTDTSGHADIKVSDRLGFLWICEAKVHGSYDWLKQGYFQLTTRYTVGGPKKDKGCLLIYCYVRDAQNVLLTWMERMQEEIAGVTIINTDSGYSITEQTHSVSGLPYYVRHKIVPLHYSPEK